ncbi:DUF2834 domain-containing protein [Pseudonocardia nematodicida]|uniref:DUF2834 domain-containing protein n=1 Tax=Pseudonocardia nematodicida TaxID=1206997 RepID=A0ABV1KHE0_9PSEU
MTTPTDRRPSRTRPHTTLIAVYGVLAVLGLVGTWYFNIAFMASGGGSYLGGWFANDASSSAAVDILVVALAACVLFVVEGRRLGWGMPPIVVLVVLSFAVAVAFTFPLFLALRERSLARTGPGAPAARAGGSHPS